MGNCKFCKIANRQIPSWVVYENEKVIAFLPEQLEVYGHTLVAPKQHYADLYDIPEDVLCELIKVSKKITIAYKEKINSTAMNLMYASGVDGLVGSMTNGGYGFAMNTFLQASIILPPVCYDDRYTRAIGK